MRTFFRSSLVIAATFFTATTLQAQNMSKDDFYAHQEKKFKLGMKYNDPELAKNAIIDMLILNPARVELKDSLALIYFETGRFDICKKLTDDILANNSKDMLALELRAFSEQNLNMAEPALNDFDALYIASQNSYYLYQTAIIRYNGKKQDAALADVNKMLSNSDLDKQVIDVLFEDDVLFKDG